MSPGPVSGDWKCDFPALCSEELDGEQKWALKLPLRGKRECRGPTVTSDSSSCSWSGTPEASLGDGRSCRRHPRVCCKGGHGGTYFSRRDPSKREKKHAPPKPLEVRTLVVPLADHPDSFRFIADIEEGKRGIETKCAMNVMCFNHPQTITPTPDHGKLYSTELVLVAKTVGDPC